MRPPIIPARPAIAALSAVAVAALVALLFSYSVTAVFEAAMTALGMLAAATAWDYARSLRAWRLSSPTLTRSDRA